MQDARRCRVRPARDIADVLALSSWPGHVRYDVYTSRWIGRSFPLCPRWGERVRVRRGWLPRASWDDLQHDFQVVDDLRDPEPDDAIAGLRGFGRTRGVCLLPVCVLSAVQFRSPVCGPDRQSPRYDGEQDVAGQASTADASCAMLARAPVDVGGIARQPDLSSMSQQDCRAPPHPDPLRPDAGRRGKARP
jgi:hypothetical protein